MTKNRIRWSSTLDKDLLDRLETLLAKRRREIGRNIRLNDLVEESIVLLLKKEGMMSE